MTNTYWTYPLVNLNKKLWKITMLMGKSTISMAIFKFANCKRLPVDIYWFQYATRDGMPSLGLEHIHFLRSRILSPSQQKLR